MIIQYQDEILIVFSAMGYTSDLCISHPKTLVIEKFSSEKFIEIWTWNI